MWNQIEHWIFCLITEDWWGRSLMRHEVVVNLIGATTTKASRATRSKLDEGRYPTGRQAARAQGRNGGRPKRLDARKPTPRDGFVPRSGANRLRKLTSGVDPQPGCEQERW